MWVGPAEIIASVPLWFSERANYLLADVLEYLGLDISFITSLRISFSEALNPHVNRRRYTEEWWA